MASPKQIWCQNESPPPYLMFPIQRFEDHHVTPNFEQRAAHESSPSFGSVAFRHGIQFRQKDEKSIYHPDRRPKRE
jgi:hypothetical protein